MPVRWRHLSDYSWRILPCTWRWSLQCQDMGSLKNNLQYWTVLVNNSLTATDHVSKPAACTRLLCKPNVCITCVT